MIYSTTVESRRISLSKLAFWLTFVVAAPAAFDLPREGAAIGLAALVVLPGILIWAATRRLIIADPVVVLGVMWIMAVTLPVLLPGLYEGGGLWNRVSLWALDNAAIWMYRAWAAFCLCYWACRALLERSRPHRPVQKMQLTHENRLRWAVGIAGFLGSVAYTVITGAQGYSFMDSGAQASTVLQIIQLLKQFSIVYVFLYFHARARRRLANVDKYILLSVLGAQAIIFIAAGTKAMILSLGAAWLLGNAMGSKKSSLVREFVAGSVALAGIYAVFYVVTAFRNEMVSRNPPRDMTIMASISLQADALQTAIGDALSGKELGSSANRYDTGDMLDRLAHLPRFALVLDMTQGESPLENAYASLFVPVYAILPRDLVGGKVHFLDSGDFARLQGWSFGGISPTQPGSFFWAWGYWGIMPGMALLGVLIAFLDVRGKREGPIGLIYRAVMIGMVVSLLDVGVTFQSVLTNSTRTFLLLLIMYFTTRSNFRPHSKRRMQMLHMSSEDD